MIFSLANNYFVGILTSSNPPEKSYNEGKNFLLRQNNSSPILVVYNKQSTTWKKSLNICSRRVAATILLTIYWPRVNLSEIINWSVTWVFGLAPISMYREPHSFQENYSKIRTLLKTAECCVPYRIRCDCTPFTVAQNALSENRILRRKPTCLLFIKRLKDN